MSGHAVEARVYAEDPAEGFLPTGGPVLAVIEPATPSGGGRSARVRVDSGLRAGMTVGSDYDPMLAKVIAHGADRAEALGALDRALAGTAVLGVGTNIDFLRFVLADTDVAAGLLDTGLLERLHFKPGEPGDDPIIAAAAYRWLLRWPSGAADAWDLPSGWRVGAHAPTGIRLRCGQRTTHVHITGTPQQAGVIVEGGQRCSLTAYLDGPALVVAVDGVRRTYTVASAGQQIWLAGDDGTALVEEVREAPVRATE